MDASPKTVRENMIKSQILTGNVLEQHLLAALASVERELFVPPALRASAYVDEELPLGGGRFLMEPLVFARFLAHAAIEPHETVLDVGAGSGYSSAVISHIARKVVAVEEETNLVLCARMLLADYTNVLFAQGKLTDGVAQEGPYDVILIEGAIEVLPQALADQLREGGRLLAVEHDASAKVAAAGLGKLVEYKKLRGKLYKVVLNDASVSLLPAFARPVAFAL